MTEHMPHTPTSPQGGPVQGAAGEPMVFRDQRGWYQLTPEARDIGIRMLVDGKPWRDILQRMNAGPGPDIPIRNLRNILYTYATRRGRKLTDRRYRDGEPAPAHITEDERATEAHRLCLSLMVTGGQFSSPYLPATWADGWGSGPR